MLARFEMTFDVFSENITFKIHSVAGLAVAEIGVFVGVGDNGDFDAAIVPAGYGETDAVDGDGAFGHDVASEMLGDCDAEPPVFAFPSEMRDFAGCVDVAEHEMAAEFLSGGEWLLKIDACSCF